MGPLATIERFLERLFERPAARLPGARLEPVTIVRRLERAIDQERRAGIDGLVAPTRFAITVNAADATSLARLTTLEDELADAALAHARRRGYRIPERPTVAVVGDPALPPGEVRVTAAFREAGHEREPSPAATPDRTLVHPLPPVLPPGAVLRVLAVHGPARDMPLDGRPLTIGRAADADVVVADPLVSRHHARLAPRSGRLVITDLGSTNGTLVNGQAVRESVVGPGDRVQLGGTRLEIIAPGAGRVP